MKASKAEERRAKIEAPTDGLADQVNASRAAWHARPTTRAENLADLTWCQGYEAGLRTIMYGPGDAAARLAILTSARDRTAAAERALADGPRS